jgi:hypothetical protein
MVLKKSSIFKSLVYLFKLQRKMQRNGQRNGPFHHIARSNIIQMVLTYFEICLNFILDTFALRDFFSGQHKK